MKFSIITLLVLVFAAPVFSQSRNINRVGHANDAPTPKPVSDDLLATTDLYSPSFGVEQSNIDTTLNNREVIQNALARVHFINGYYHRNQLSEVSVGVIPQEVENVFPEVVETHSNGIKSVDHAKLSALLIEALKEQQDLIERQQFEIRTQQDVLKDLEKRIRTVEAILDAAGMNDFSNGKIEIKK